MTGIREGRCRSLAFGTEHTFKEEAGWFDVAHLDWVYGETSWWPLSPAQFHENYREIEPTPGGFVTCPNCGSTDVEPKLGFVGVLYCRKCNDIWCDPTVAPPTPSTTGLDAAERKRVPIASGVLDYFPDAIAAVAHCSWVGNEQHNPGQPLHWAREKSTDEADALIRHFTERGKLDSDGVRHSAKVAWRALALLQKEIEQGRG